MEFGIPKCVWWDMDCCQVPRGRDPNEIRRRIESALNKKFGPGPVTIFAIGNLNRSPRRVLELIFRAGIVLKHTSHGGSSIIDDLDLWTKRYPAPAILMLISDREEEYDEDLEIAEAKGYTIIRTYVNQIPDPPEYACDVWLWKTLITDTKLHENTPRPWQELQGKCCETGDWYCIICLTGGQSFTDFTTHCKTRQHLLIEWAKVVNQDTSVVPTDEDLAYLHSQLINNTVKQTEPRKHSRWHGRDKLRKSHNVSVRLKLLSEPPKSLAGYFTAFTQQSHTVPPDCSVVPSDKDVASFHSQPKKQSKQHIHFCSHLRGGERKLNESLWVPPPNLFFSKMAHNCIVVPSDKDVASLHSQPQEAVKKSSKPLKHFGSHLKGGECKLNESHWVPPPNLFFSSLPLSTQECSKKNHL